MRIASRSVVVVVGALLVAGPAMAINMLNSSQSKAMKECMDKSGLKSGADEKQRGKAVSQCYATVAPPPKETPKAPPPPQADLKKAASKEAVKKEAGAAKKAAKAVKADKVEKKEE